MKKLLQDWLRYHAEATPDRTAVELEHDRLTYAQLEVMSNQLSHMLKTQGCQRGDRICFAIPKSPMAIVAILGILKADCIYTPLDLSSPRSRTEKILGSCQNKWILYTHAALKLLEGICENDRYRLSLSFGLLESDTSKAGNFSPSFTLVDIEAMPRTSSDFQNSETDPAYILFTSGSTGIPKGVTITHGNVISFIEWAKKYFDIRSSDRLSGHFPLYFDLSVFDIFGAQSAGAELHQVPSQFNMFPNKLAEFIRNGELTHWFSVPSALNLMMKFDVVRELDFPSLKRALWCGEVLPTPTLIYWMKRLPHVSFTNLYGPTEATIASSYYTVPDIPESEKVEIPIGSPCDGESLLVLNEEMKPAAISETGDLYIGGSGLSPGYWNDEEKSAQVFLKNMSGLGPHDRIYKTGDLAKLGNDGLVYFVGRADSQIKSRGYRIELGEIETSLNALSGISQGAVVAVVADGFEGATICCAFVPKNGEQLTPIMLRKKLSESLPDYMLPARWMQYNSLPTNSNGKIDRPMLREQFRLEIAGTKIVPNT